MSRIASTRGDVRLRTLRRQFAPILSTLAACLIAVLPIVMTTTIIPDFGLLVLIAWRLLRPEMWTPVTVLPLGLFNDLVAGHPLGQSMALWTILFLIYDIMDARLVWRDYWMDWFVASLSIVFYTYGVWYIGQLMGNSAEFTVMLPQVGLAIFCYPIIARLVLIIDRWRLAR